MLEHNRWNFDETYQEPAETSLSNLMAMGQYHAWNEILKAAENAFQFSDYHMLNIDGEVQNGDRTNLFFVSDSIGLLMKKSGQSNAKNCKSQLEWGSKPYIGEIFMNVHSGDGLKKFNEIIEAWQNDSGNRSKYFRDGCWDMTIV